MGGPIVVSDGMDLPDLFASLLQRWSLNRRSQVGSPVGWALNFGSTAVARSVLSNMGLAGQPQEMHVSPTWLKEGDCGSLTWVPLCYCSGDLRPRH
jgi:hypothetical protein